MKFARLRERADARSDRLANSLHPRKRTALRVELRARISYEGVDAGTGLAEGRGVLAQRGSLARRRGPAPGPAVGRAAGERQRLGLGYRRTVDAEVSATVNAAAILLNLLVLVFVFWLTVHLDPEVRSDEALWLLLLYAAPPANGLAIAARRVDDGGTVPP
jgi:hypothetical protein